MRDLIKLDLWTSSVKNQIIANNGSVQSIKEIPQNIKDIYKTVWEISQKKMMNLAIARGPYICQSQSLNLYQENPQFNKMSLMHFHSWRSGLKTGQYYFRSRPARDAIKFTVNVDMLLKAADGGNANQVMECLNTDNKGKKRTKATKPASLQSDNMRKPLSTKAINVTNVDDVKMNEDSENTTKAPANMPKTVTRDNKEEESDGSDDFVCHACSS